MLYLGFVSARESTLDLLRDRAEIGLELLEARVRGRLDPVADLTAGIGAMIGDGVLDPSKPDQVHAAFRGALAALPQVSAIVFIDSLLRVLRVGRNQDPLLELVETTVAVAGTQGMTATHDGMVAVINEAAGMDGTRWLPPLWIGGLGQPILSLEAPVRIDGVFAGVLFAGVELGELADFLAQLEAEESERAFILYDGRHVLAHPSLARTMRAAYGDAIGDEVPLPEATTFADAAIAGLAAAPPSALDPAPGEMRMFDSRAVGDLYLVTVREILGYGTRPWISDWCSTPPRRAGRSTTCAPRR